MIRNLIKSCLYLLGYIFHHNKDSKIVYYHDVSTKYTDMGTDFSLFKSHIDIIRKSGYEIVDEITKSHGQVMICFDDGWEGIYDYKDFFLENNIRPTIFVAVELIDKDGFLTKSQILELYSLGFFFESHTWTHTGLPEHVGKDIEHELMDSKLILEKMFNHPFDAICFPQGRYNSDVIKHSLEFGYKKLYSSIPGGYFLLKKENLICRNLAQSLGPINFRFMLNGEIPLMRRKLVKQHQS